MDFLGMGWPEILVIAVVAIIVVGPEKLPEYMRKIGKYYRKLKKMTTGVTRDFKSAINLDEDESLTGSLDSIKASLEEDAEELRRSLDVDLEDVADSVNESADNLNESLNEAAESVNESLGDIDDIDLSTLDVENKNPDIYIPSDNPQPQFQPETDIMGMPIDPPVQDSSND